VRFLRFARISVGEPASIPDQVRDGPFAGKCSGGPRCSSRPEIKLTRTSRAEPRVIANAHPAKSWRAAGSRASCSPIRPRFSISTLEKGAISPRPAPLYYASRPPSGSSRRWASHCAPTRAPVPAAARGRARRARLLFAPGCAMDRGASISHAAALVRRQGRDSTLPYRLPHRDFVGRGLVAIEFPGNPSGLDAAFTQQGVVSVPNPSGHNLSGHQCARPIPADHRGPSDHLGRDVRDPDHLQVGRGAQLTPVAAPIALLPLGQNERGAIRRPPSDRRTRATRPTGSISRRTVEEPLSRCSCRGVKLFHLSAQARGRGARLRCALWSRPIFSAKADDGLLIERSTCSEAASTEKFAEPLAIASPPPAASRSS